MIEAPPSLHVQRHACVHVVEPIAFRQPHVYQQFSTRPADMIYSFPVASHAFVSALLLLGAAAAQREEELLMMMMVDGSWGGGQQC